MWFFLSIQMDLFFLLKITNWRFLCCGPACKLPNLLFLWNSYQSSSIQTCSAICFASLPGWQNQWENQNSFDSVKNSEKENFWRTLNERIIERMQDNLNNCLYQDVKNQDVKSKLSLKFNNKIDEARIQSFRM